MLFEHVPVDSKSKKSLQHGNFPPRALPSATARCKGPALCSTKSPPELQQKFVAWNVCQ